MSFLEIFKRNGNEQVIEESVAEEVVHRETEEEIEERLRLTALRSSEAATYINRLSVLPEVRVLYPSTWHPKVCVLDQSHIGDKPKWDCFDIVGKTDGSISIGSEFLNKREASDPELVDYAFLKAHERAQPVFGDPRASANS